MTSETDKELRQLKKRLSELARKSWLQNIYCFTGFLGMAQLDVFYGIEREIAYAGYALFGGYEGSERQMIRFGSTETVGYEEPFPVICLEIRPLAEKFADRLSHRDFLGACMNLGIDRGTLGDIVVKENGAYLYCTDTIGDYIADQLSRVRHTAVSCRKYTGEAEHILSAPEKREYQLSSGRADAVVARVYGLSREKSALLFRERRIFVNGREQENISAMLKEGDIISVRGHGKFIYRGLTHRTRKGKCNIAVEVYV